MYDYHYKTIASFLPIKWPICCKQIWTKASISMTKNIHILLGSIFAMVVFVLSTGDEVFSALPLEGIVHGLDDSKQPK